MNKATTQKDYVRYVSPAQMPFIREMRKQIENGDISYRPTNWMYVGDPRRFRTEASAELFRLKHVYPWAPHLFAPDYRVHCPECKQSTYFHATVSWTQRQVFVYNMSTHGLLDSNIYKCNNCNNSFSGCSAESMKQDSTGIVGAAFNIRLVGNFAMGLELIRYIVGCKSLTPTQKHCGGARSCVHAQL